MPILREFRTDRSDPITIVVSGFVAILHRSANTVCDVTVRFISPHAILNVGFNVFSSSFSEFSEVFSFSSSVLFRSPQSWDFSIDLISVQFSACHV